jgi:putative mRNA 3-end processing factor
VICTHGYTDIFSKYLQEIGYEASIENTAYEGEKEDTTAEPIPST